MKSFGTYNPPETVGLEFVRLATPSGNALPRSPIPGELFTMNVDAPDPMNGSPWYLKGTYVFDGVSWVRISDGKRRRLSQPIGAQKIEFEVPGFIADDTPSSTSGVDLATIQTQPSNQRASLSGHTSMWVDLSSNGHVWLMVFRDRTLVGMTVDYIESGKPRTISLTFKDQPSSKKQQLYTLKVNTDLKGNVFVNSSTKFKLGGISQTAFIIEEDV